ncbi:MAG TPA: hypothetical protein VET48_14770 [Steroidobacteraceae bacterium]|nr:hypothetical protein [Steroidobacteraceae bacterium]
MNDNARKQALRNAVLDWQQRHNIADDDPLLATVELWEAFLDSAKVPDSSTAAFDTRREIEQLDRISKAFAKQIGEVIRELRTMPKLKGELWMFPYFTVIFVAVLALVAGMLVGKFLL